jgi:hypothetical protein
VDVGDQKLSLVVRETVHSAASSPPEPGGELFSSSPCAWKSLPKLILAATPLVRLWIRDRPFLWIAGIEV